MSSYLYRRVLRIHIHIPHNPSSFLRNFTTSSPPQPPPSHSSTSFTVDFLTRSCFLPLDKALSAAQTLRLDETNPQQPESVVALLKSHGFLDSHIAELIAKRPTLLRSQVESKLFPKLQFLTQMGISGSDLFDLVIHNPGLLRRSLEHHLKPSLEFLRCFVGSTENVLSVLRRHRWFLTFDLRATVIPNVALLVDMGVPIAPVSKLITTHPRAVMLSHDRFSEIVSAVKRLGIRPEQCLFAHAVRAMSGLSKKSYAAKIELFKSLGWSEEEVLSAFRRFPLFMLVSEEKIRAGSEFFMRVGMKPKELSSQPKLLMFGLEKRNRPRFAVLQFLRSKGLKRKNIESNNLVSMFFTSEKLFLEKYVTGYMDIAPEVMDVYLGKIKVDELMLDSGFGEENRVAQKL